MTKTMDEHVDAVRAIALQLEGADIDEVFGPDCAELMRRALAPPITFETAVAFAHHYQRTGLLQHRVRAFVDRVRDAEPEELAARVQGIQQALAALDGTAPEPDVRGGLS